MMKKFIAGSLLSAVVLSVSALPVSAQVTRVEGPVEYGDWIISPNKIIDFTCGGGEYLHTLNTVVNGTDGELSGTGTYNPNTGYTWTMIGDVNGNEIEMQITYTGIASGSVYNLDGVIAEDGSISGGVDSNCESFTMPAGTATRTSSQFIGNHGQFVKSQEIKQEAAHSRIGMPVQSKGHTK